jgi:O-antigen/teichoic acid export membrane protein
VLISTLVFARPEVAFLNHYASPTAVGLYSIALALSSLAMQGPVLLTNGLVPYFAENSEGDRRSAVSRFLTTGMKLMALIVFPMCFGSAAIGQNLIGLLFGERFQEASSAAALLLAFSSLSGLTVFFAGLITAAERSDFNFFLNLGGAAIVLLSGYTLIPSYGIVGAACSRATVFLFMFVCSAIFVNVKLKLDVPYRTVAAIALAALLCVIPAYLISASYHGLVAVIISVLSSCLVYLVLLKFMRILDSNDIETLTKLIGSLPRRLRGPGFLFLRLVLF